MNIQKLVAIVGAILINVAVLLWFHAWSATGVASAAPAASPGTVVTLPAVNVHPSAEQLRLLRTERPALPPRQSSVGDAAACLAMPYYSFATPCGVKVDG